MTLKDSIRTIPDFPKPGIMYRDITTLLADPKALKESIAQLAKALRAYEPDMIAGIEARGFIFGAAVAAELGLGFIPVRKAGKLPHETYSQDYELEYVTDTLEVHKDVMSKGARVVLVDDLIATGGTALAAAALLRRAGAMIVAAGFVIDLPDLGGAQKLEAADISAISLVAYAGH